MKTENFKDPAEIEVSILGKPMWVKYDKTDFPLYHSETYGPNKEYREDMIRRHILNAIYNQGL